MFEPHSTMVAYWCFLHLNHPTMIAHDADITVHNIYI